jgi:hypothetical protein
MGEKLERIGQRLNRSFLNKMELVALINFKWVALRHAD